MGMTELPLYQVDAFTERRFGGNPAAVIPLEAWLDDALMQTIALENNLSETAFFVPDGDGFHLRWFTPAYEVALCGHATLASAFVLMTILEPNRTEVNFASKSGPLFVRREGSSLSLDFPRTALERMDRLDGLDEALGVAVVETWRAGSDTLVVLEDEPAVIETAPDMRFIEERCDRALMVTAPSDEDDVDFVSRFFAPGAGIPEDPVTGSAHCALAPYWAERLGRQELVARQRSPRGGELRCIVNEERVQLMGNAVLTLEGKLYL